ncbi:hypothetical protein LARI1_G003570 [Lachnellula arida]|uniref:Uncharacterized protein n=1 Tax=Lachnellula arida TaxID=1316785 RepID=A0A8T9BHM0_9HELO|nr:hypothetical protein LARI1_G003570 [Lachnellula arida]
MPPLPAPSDIWTPDVIATVVYRAIMVIVSIAFLWRAYRQPVRAVDDEHVVGIILPNTSARTASASLGDSSPEVPSSSKSLMHDFITSQIESILQSTLGIGDIGIGDVGIGDVGIGDVGIGDVGIGDVGNDTPPAVVRNHDRNTSSTAGSSTSASRVKAAHRAQSLSRNYGPFRYISC